MMELMQGGQYFDCGVLPLDAEEPVGKQSTSTARAVRITRRNQIIVEWIGCMR